MQTGWYFSSVIDVPVHASHQMKRCAVQATLVASSAHALLTMQPRGYLAGVSWQRWQGGGGGGRQTVV